MKLKKIISWILVAVLIVPIVSIRVSASEPGANWGAEVQNFPANGSKGTTGNGELKVGEVQVKKEAYATAIPNEYDISLTVRGRNATKAFGGNVILVLDRSGSMKDDWKTVQGDADVLIDKLAKIGTVNVVIVTFSKEGEVRK